MKIPVFCPTKIQYDFDQQRIKKELLDVGIFDHSKVATTVYQNGKSMWQPDGVFEHDDFKKVKNIHHYTVDKDGNRTLIDGEYNTFQMVNLTERDEYSKQESWEGKNTVKDGKVTTGDKLPLWIKYKHPWKFRGDLDIPYTYRTISRLPFEYVQTVRCILQQPPSIGVVHADSGPKTNSEYYDEGFASITLNIDAGNANLWFYNKADDTEYMVDESRWSTWHFNDALSHCTTEVMSPRIQLRIFGKLESSVNYLDLLDLEQAVW